MRTTLNIEDEALLAVKKYAEQRQVSLGQAASDLIHRGEENLPTFKMKNGWVVFDVPAEAPAITNENVEQWENEDNEEEYGRAFSPRR